MARPMQPPVGRVRAASEASRAWVSRSASTVALVLTVGSADMPGRSRPFRRWSSSTIFTGTRCTILVKLPVALSGGSSANSRPLAGDRLSTWPRQPGAVETVDLDLDRLAVAHMRELRLLEIRDHIDRIQRHHRHQLRAGLHILPDPERTRADRAVDRRRDLRVGEIERRLLLDRAGAIDLRDRLGALGGEHVDLALGGEAGRTLRAAIARCWRAARRRSAARAAPCRSRSSSARRSGPVLPGRI